MMSDPLRFNDAIWERAEQLGFSLDMITSEYDSPQFEYTLTFDDALKAVDDIIIPPNGARNRPRTWFDCHLCPNRSQRQFGDAY